MVEGALMAGGVVARAAARGTVGVETLNLRDFSTRADGRVDSPVYGGGPGMLLRPEPVAAGIRAALKRRPKARVALLAASGAPFTQTTAKCWASKGQDIILVCGRYEGIDERIQRAFGAEQISFGSAVLTGGELPAACVVDATARMVPGVLGSAESAVAESFSAQTFGGPEWPQFTRPPVWEGQTVPAALRSGDHAAIDSWRQKNLPNLSAGMRRVLAARMKLPSKTRRLRLRLPRPTDAEVFFNALADPLVRRYIWMLGGAPTKTECTEFLETQSNNLRAFFAVIEDKKTGEVLGNARLDLCNADEGRAEFGLLISNKKRWGEGIGTEATREMVKIGFEELGLRKIELHLNAENAPARRVYEKCGFTLCGRKKAHYAGESPGEAELMELVRG